MKFHKDGTSPKSKETIFVFGSNLAGIHGAGAARHANINLGAVWGVGEGMTGSTYAIPTKDFLIRTLPLESIKVSVQTFLDYAKDNLDTEFFVTRIGCVLAGYTDADIAPMFIGATSNCSFAEEWAEYMYS
jgi:hypothetical protein